MSLARALLTPTNILVLDEATVGSSESGETENQGSLTRE